MNQKTVIILAIFALVGVFFLGKGITGYVISQTCCFPPNCNEEDMCDLAKPKLESPANNQDVTNIYLGGALFSVSAIAYIILHKKEKA